MATSTIKQDNIVILSRLRSYSYSVTCSNNASLGYTKAAERSYSMDRTKKFNQEKRLHRFFLASTRVLHIISGAKLDLPTN
jgi:hypothetical protein